MSTHWLVGIDPRPSARGALEFARWLGRHLAEGSTIDGVHVLLDQLRTVSGFDVENLVDRARNEVESLWREVQTPAGRARTVFGPSPYDALVEEAARGDACALIVGRQAASPDQQLVRLGGVARKLVRTLPLPIIVVPPDVDADRIGIGPVLLASDLTDASSGAAVFAQRFAAEVGRGVAVAHVAQGPDESLSSLVPAATLSQLYGQLGLDRRHDLPTWLADHGLRDAPHLVAEGEPIDRLLSIVEQERVPLLVCGARQTEGMDRVFIASVGTELSRHARCPVAIVPQTVRR